MARLNDLPFDRGDTFDKGNTSVSTQDGTNLEGKEYLIEDTNNGTGAYVRLRATRNRSGFALAPKRLVATGGNNLLGQVAGYASTTQGQYVAGVVDDQYTSSVPDKDLFWMVVEGPVLVKTALEANANNVVNLNDWLINTTGATTGATTGGRAMTAVLTGATATLAANILNVWGRAMSAATTSNTDNDLLVDVVKRD